MLFYCEEYYKCSLTQRVNIMSNRLNLWFTILYTSSIQLKTYLQIIYIEILSSLISIEQNLIATQIITSLDNSPNVINCLWFS